jgi:hypothetical protein
VGGGYRKLEADELKRESTLRPKSEIAPPSTEVKSGAISNLSTTEVVSKMAAWLGQAQAANLYSDKASAVDASRSARDLFPLISSSLRSM